MEGMASNVDNEIDCISIRSINPKNSNLNLVEKMQEIENGVRYSYVKIRNKKFISYYDMIKNSYVQLKNLLRNLNSGENAVVFTDVLSICAVVSTLIFCKIHKIKSCAIITDLPNLVTAINKGNQKSKLRDLKDKFLNFMIQKYDGYCFLTESMNEINYHRKPYTIIEGIATDNSEDKLISEKNQPFTIMYAGGLYAKFGVKKLVDSMEFLQNKNIMLCLYGEGELKDYIRDKGNINQNIKYMGIYPSNQIFEFEKKADLLINCRSSHEEFTKYSFPSKTIEYMSSGTPVLTTKLRGIPREYYPYLFFIEEETEKGIAESIRKITEMEQNKLNAFGFDAKRFVTENKNKNAQGRKLIDFVRRI
jgi:glycosyltransferase involved in cell wall biosynthesis